MILDKIKTHLEFLGYEVTEPKKESEEAQDRLLARHPEKPNYLVLQMLPFALLFTATYSIEKGTAKEWDSVINEANQQAGLSRIYYNVDEKKEITLVFEGVFIGEYSRELFGQYFERLQREPGLTLQLKSVQKLIE